jgi:para-nitrobenzyl esterase
MTNRKNESDKDSVHQSQKRSFGRRFFFMSAAGTASGAVLMQTRCSPQNAGKKAEVASYACPTILTASDSITADTISGKVRGYQSNGIHTFRGIPYAATTEGQGRFMPPAKPKSWTGIRPCMWYGPICPQAWRTGWSNDEMAFLSQWNDGQPGEDCLRVNVWTPGLSDGKKRPVMVWLHGGGWAAGSGQEQPAYHGENLSRRGDVVVVSLNHRLNILGYMNLAAYGDKYASSMNIGVLDLVAALEWVRDNITNFGGDPGNVLIFGQSGGGGKVSTLTSMPMANGLFHKAAVQSGSTLRLGDPELNAKLAAGVVAELGLTKASIDKIQTVPYARLLEAQDAALKKLQPKAPPGGIGMPTVRGAAPRMAFSPVVDGKIVTRHPYDPDAPDVSTGVPMMIGTTLNEMSPSIFDGSFEAMSDDEMKKRAEERYGNKAGIVAEAYRKAYPDVKPVELLSRMFSVRTNAVTQAERKAAKSAAPAYMYLFAWQTPVLDGRPRAFHCSEIPFVFYNTDVSAFSTGGGDEARELAAKVSDAWLNFSRKGDPNHSGLPNWPVYNAQTGPVMVFDKVCEVKNDPDRELRKVVAQALEPV